jgi:filamentous hemagglutinin family protein
MNRIYRIVWSQVSNTWIAVAENARGRGKSTAATRLVAAALTLAGVSWGMSSVYAASAADAAVSAGSGHISTVGNTTTIDQASQRMAIDWTSLSTAANEALLFNQPNASAIALNRITGASPSALLGSLTANGQVYILNPNGVLFGAGAQVNVGGLVASTLSMNPADFMAGGSTFAKDPAASGSVVNQGTITAADGGYAALIGGTVRNEGTITTPLGTSLLAAGDKVTLNLNNGSLIGYSIDQGALHALVENRQLIQADGGQVLMSAKALDQLGTAVINNTGVIEARTVQNKAGRILLMGDMDVGQVNVGGTLDASAPTGGDGGFIETSAAHVKVAEGTLVTTKAASGKTGKWLIDPNDFTIAASSGDMTAATVSSNLDSTNFEIATTTMGSAGGNGDIFVNEALSWSSANTLTLTAERDVNFNANLTYFGSGTAGVTVQAVRDINVGASVTVTSTGTGALPVVFGGSTVGTAAGGAITMGSGSSIATQGGDVTFKANAIKLAGATVAAAGGNIAMTAAGSSASHSLEITDAGGTGSNVSTTGAGTITLSGSLTGGGASATGGSASGVVVTNSDITGGTGAISITGHAGGVSTGGQLERGFRLDSGALITSAGNISLTGTVSGNQAITPDPYPLKSTGGELAHGATVSSSGGDLALSGTFNNTYQWDGTGLAVGGKLQSGADKKIVLTGNATVGVRPVGGGNFDGSGTGLSTGSSSEIVAGTGGLAITGTVWSSSTSSNLIGTLLTGAANSTGNIAVTGTASAPSAYGVTALSLAGGTLAGLGTATVTLRGSGVPAPAPAYSYDVSVNGTTVSTAGGDISLVGNRVKIDSTINSGSGRTVITTYTASRDITLNGGSGSEQNGLNLSNSELNSITASVLQLGGGAYSGDISFGNNGGATTMTSTPALSLVTTGSITQTAGLTVNSLKAVGSSVTLSHANNQISNISGIATSGSFQAASASGLTVGTVDGVSGINSAGKVLVRTTGANADLTLASAVTSASTANDSLVLVAGRNFINNVGAAALQIPGAARWQVWSTNPANDSRNNLGYDFKQYNATYGTTTVASTGNGVFYTLAPTITSALTGTVSKTYDTTTAATLTAANFSAAAGAVDGDTVSLNTSTTGTYNNKNAGTGKTVTATGVSIASATNGSKSVYGYTLGSASGNIGTINQASLAVNGISAVDKVYDASTTAALTGTAAISALGSDVVTVGGTGIGTFTDKNVGTAKAVAVNGYTLSGADAGNYALIQPTGLTANITPKALGYSTITAADKTYDGNTTAVATLSGLTGLIGSETVTVSRTEATFNSKDVASANLVTVNSVTLADGANGGLASNYSIASGGTAAASITAKALGYSTTAANKTYDGTTVATLSGSLSGVVVGDTVALGQSGTFSDKNAATGKTVSYTSSLSGSDAGNYMLASSSGTATADITPALLTVAANSANKFYDGVAYADNNGVTISGLVNGESVADLSGSLGYGGSSQGAIGIGNYAITPGGLSSTNYSMDFVDGVLTIKPLSQTSAALGGPTLEPAYDSARQTVFGNTNAGGLTHQSGNQSGQSDNVPETSTLGAGSNSSSNGGIEDITPRLNLAGCGVNMPVESDCQ